MGIRTAIDGVGTFTFDHHAETMSRKALTALQVSRLKQTLEHAYANVSHYRKKFDAAGVGPGDFRSASIVASRFFPRSILTLGDRHSG